MGVHIPLDHCTVTQINMSGSVSTIKLNDGAAIPWLAWGNGTGNAKKQALDAGKQALQAGIDHIDTAQIYTTEPETLQAIQETKTPREKVRVTSKIFKPEETDEETIASIQSSLDKLGGTPELYLIHNPFLDNPDRVLPTWRILEKLKDEGKLKSIGVSNFRPKDLELILREGKHKPAVNQLEFHPFVLKHLEPVLKIQKELGIIAVLLLWCKAHDVVAVTASANAERIKGLAALAKLDVNLTKEEVDEIDAEGSKYHFRYYTEHMKTDFPEPDLPKDNIFHVERKRSS